MLKKIVPSWLQSTNSGTSSSCSESGGASSRNKRKQSIAVQEALGKEKSSGTQIEEIEEPEVEQLHLTMEQKELLKSSWTIIYSEMGHSLCYVGDGDNYKGVAGTFLKLFEEYPKSQEFFTKFRDKSIDKLRDDVRLSSVLQEHAIRVMQVVEKVIARIESPDKVTPFLLNLGKFHRLSGVPNDYFGVMGTIFLFAVRPYLEASEKWDEATEDAWMELFGHIARVMTHGHKYYHLTKGED